MLVTAVAAAAVMLLPASEGTACLFHEDVDLRCSSSKGRCTDLRSVSAATQAACCSSCQADSRCNAAVWVLEGRIPTCFLKNLASGTTLSSHRPGAVGCLPVGPPTPPPPPTPFYPFRNSSLPFQERVQDLVGRLTLDEKILQMTRGGARGNTPAPAIERLGLLPHIWGSECATGLGSDDGSFAGTSFPQPLGQAATWDKALIRQVAEATHVELRAQHNEDLRRSVVEYHHGINCWSPVINIMRHWAWGRNDETYGECPVLSGAFASSFVKGLQGDDPRYVAATAGCKHFVVHGGPDTLRQTFSANVTLRDWATTFLPQFEACVQAGGLGLMCSFNSIRGTPACANHRAMKTWAKGQWKFPGYIVPPLSHQLHKYGDRNHELTEIYLRF
jgi:hypothetical protein